MRKDGAGRPQRKGERIRTGWRWRRWGRPPSSWLLVEVRTAHLRLPIYIPFPLGWLAEAMQGASWCTAAYEWVRGKPIRVGPWPRGLGQTAGLGQWVAWAAQALRRVRQEGAFTLASVESEQTCVRVRVL